MKYSFKKGGATELTRKLILYLVQYTPSLFYFQRIEIKIKIRKNLTLKVCFFIIFEEFKRIFFYLEAMG